MLQSASAAGIRARLGRNAIGTAMTEEVDVRILSDPRWLRLARLVVEHSCREFGLEETQAREIVIAVDEALSNVMRHGYGGVSTLPIRMVCRSNSQAVEVEIWDRGIEFNPLEQPVPPPNELRRGGRGLFLIRSSVDECEYQRRDGWNRIRLRKLLPVAAGEG